ncbi:hypothetical protein JIN84_11545 [Luteolibacter yonseiensis]|uniref:F5/8 type C domain-containing protein n=1 Tax=Luteolibacter yonseiensis TaxID=1144680 RepID=A0A934VAI4_9BACT|nr:L-type lectin-domain containing protein [Luteolibacter yonseiensis]MBK1816248.1 hypothetical protein [Luteolibacter yonseiensis]
MFRPQALLAAVALLSALPASAAEKAYRYYQFKTTKLVGNGSNVMLSEFDFYHAGTKLNIRNKTGVGASIPCEATAGTDTPAAEDGVPNNLLDGLVETMFVRRSGLVAGNELIFDFGATTPHPVIDSYSFTTATNGSGFVRTPQSWQVYGSDDKVSWTPLTWEVDRVTVLENSTTYGPFDVPEIIPPLINSFSTPAMIVLNDTPITFSYNTQFSTERNVYVGVDTIPLAAESGTFVTTPPPNGQATAYTLVATKDDTAPAISTTLVRSVAGGASTYRYVRFKITGRRGGAGDSTVQLAEFEFYNSAVSAAKIPISGVENPGSNSPDAEKAPKIIDGITTEGGNKWLDFNNAPLIFDFGSPKTFDKYAFFTGGDAAERDPVQWTLEGSNDQSRWNLIENVNIPFATPTARNTSTLPIPLPGTSLPTQIDFFTGNTLNLIEGETLTLSYSTQAAATVTITPDGGDPLPGPLPLYGSVNVTPTVDTTYTLTAATADENAPVATATFSVVIVPDPGVDDIQYDNFASAGTELETNGSTTITPEFGTNPGRLRLTPEQQSQSGTAWFVKKLAVSGGFEATFGLSMNQEDPNGYVPADGLAFVVQNAPSGTNDPGTGENGVSQKALNICFHTFGFEPDPASLIEVRSGTTVLAKCVAFNQPGVELYGIPSVPAVDENGVPYMTAPFPYTLGSVSTDPAYRIRVVYVPGDLDVYLDGIAVIQNVNVNLSTIGAADAAGKSYFGFTARTGGNVQNSDITDWHVKLGDFSAVPPFGMVKSLFRYTAGSSQPTSVDLVWNADTATDFKVVSSLDLLPPWSLVQSAPGVKGQIGVSVDIPFNVGTADKAFFRVERVVPE